MPHDDKGVALQATMRRYCATPSESDSLASLGRLIYWGLLRGPPFGRLPQHTIQVHLIILVRLP